MNSGTALVERRGLFRQALETMLASTPHALKASAASVAEIVAAHPDQRELLFLLSGEDGDEQLRDLRELSKHYPTSRTIVISEQFDLWSTIAALQAGASGYVLSSCTGETLVRTIDLVLSGVTVLPEHFSKALLVELQWNPYTQGSGNADSHRVAPKSTPQPVLAPDFPKQFPNLSDRELDILACLTAGACNKDIARSIGMAEATVKTHLKTILRKLSVANRTQAALWALKHVPHLSSPEAQIGGEQTRPAFRSCAPE